MDNRKKATGEMNKYKKPSLVSYKSQDITEIVGPALTTFISVVGGKNTNKLPVFKKVPRLMKKSGE